MNAEHTPCIAIAGNPNSGKSSVFNALTGMRQKVANYPGVTVEEKIGVMDLPGIGPVTVIDLPGTYSLNPRSPDEEIAHDVLLGLRDDTPSPQVIVAVVDAGSLERNLFFTSQLLSTGKPVVVGLNMMDQARALGYDIDAEALSRHLGVPVIPMTASRRIGITELKAAIAAQLSASAIPHDVIPLTPDLTQQVAGVADILVQHHLVPAPAASGEALRLISSENALENPRLVPAKPELEAAVAAARRKLGAAGRTWYAVEAETRYAWIERTLAEVRMRQPRPASVTERMDRVLTHRVMGPIALLVILFSVFFVLFRFTQPPMDWIKHAFGWLAAFAERVMPGGPLRHLLTDGIIAGVGSVLVFLPQILMLFLCIAFLEDSGYMARAAFIMDRIMGAVGLPGRAFIPFLSSFACAIPGVMGARTIENARDRLVTILVAPLMCCSARWPVYFLLASVVIPDRLVLGWIPLAAIVVFAMVVLGVVAAVAMAGLFRRTLLRGESNVVVMELPRYRIPRPGTVLHVMWERGWLFVRKAGTVILAMSIVLWSLTHYPRHADVSPREQIEQSFAGKMGRTIEPFIAPLGFDWRIGVSIVSSFAAREVFVSSMGTIYGANTADLKTRLRQAVLHAAPRHRPHGVLRAGHAVRQHPRGGAPRDEQRALGALPVVLHDRAGVGRVLRDLAGRPAAGLGMIMHNAQDIVVAVLAAAAAGWLIWRGLRKRSSPCGDCDACALPDVRSLRNDRGASPTSGTRTDPAPPTDPQTHTPGTNPRAEG